MTMKEYTLGDDAGLISVTINGKSLTLCPVDTLDQMNRLFPAQAEGEPPVSGVPFTRVISKYLQDAHGVIASSYQAAEFYKTIVAAEKDVVDFFLQRLGSSTTSESTPEASAEPKS